MRYLNHWDLNLPIFDELYLAKIKQFFGGGIQY